MIRKIGLVVLLLVWCAGAALADVRSREIERLYDADGDRIFENLEERMQRAGKDELLPVLISFKENTPIAGTFAVRLSHIPAERMKRTYANFPVIALSMTPSEIREVVRDPWVEQVEFEGKMHIAMDTARKYFGVQKVKKEFGYTGDLDGIKGNYSKNDVVIAILDTGIDDRHPDLKGKVIFWKDFVGNSAAPYDDQDHGTFLAGIIAGSGKVQKKYSGVAPEAALVVMKILDHAGSGDVSDGIAAIDEVISRKNELNIRVMNLSFSISGSSSGKDAISQACNRAAANGLVVVVAAGNEGPDPRTIGSPSAATKVITVGAGADAGERGFYLADFSSRGPTADGRKKPDLWGPGIRIRTTNRSSGYTAVSGTSFATAFVSGVAALMVHANPTLSSAKIRRMLKKTAEKWAPGKKSNEAGKGRLRAYEAITSAAAVTAELQPPKAPTVRFEQTVIQSGQTHRYQIELVTKKFPIAVTAIVFNSPGAGISVAIIDPSGAVIAISSSSLRQETISVPPTLLGMYEIRVVSLFGSTKYLLDVSAGHKS